MASSSSSAADVSITREQLTKYFHLPITDVAKELGICATMLKKICRKNGIPRWPHRKIKSLNKMIESLEASLTNDGSEAGECIRQEIIILKNKKSLIMRNPSILVQGNSSKRSSEGGDEQPTGKKQRIEAMQTPVTTFNNPKASLPSTTPNSFSINQLLTPPTSFSTPLTSPAGLPDEKDYRAYAHPHALPHHVMSSMPYDPSRPEAKAHLDGRPSFASPLTSYLPEDDGRHMDGGPLLHPPSTDPYYYHKAALAYQYHSYPRQIGYAAPNYPPPPHTLSTSPHARPYYHSYGGPHEARTLMPGEAHAEATPQPTEQEQERIVQANPQQQSQSQSQSQTQPPQSPQHPLQKQQPPQAQQRIQQSPQGQPGSQESLPKMNISSSPDMYKYSRNPPSPQQSSYSQGSDLSYYYSQYPHSQQQRLHQQQ